VVSQLPFVLTWFGIVLSIVGLLITAMLVRANAREWGGGFAPISPAELRSYGALPQRAQPPQQGYEQLLHLIRVTVNDVALAVRRARGGRTPLELGARGLPFIVSLTGRLDYTPPPEAALRAHNMLSLGLRELQDAIRALQLPAEAGDGRQDAASANEAFQTIDRAFDELARAGIAPRP
jgi:hypothetical protein